MNRRCRRESWASFDAKGGVTQLAPQSIGRAALRQTSRRRAAAYQLCIAFEALIGIKLALAVARRCRAARLPRQRRRRRETPQRRVVLQVATGFLRALPLSESKDTAGNRLAGEGQSRGRPSVALRFSRPPFVFFFNTDCYLVD